MPKIRNILDFQGFDIFHLGFRPPVVGIPLEQPSSSGSSGGKISYIFRYNEKSFQAARVTVTADMNVRVVEDAR